MFTDFSKKVGTLPIWVMSFLFSFLSLGSTLNAESTNNTNLPAYIVCNDQVNVSVEDNCEAEITIAAILEGEDSYPGYAVENYKITVQQSGSEDLIEGTPGQNVTIQGIGEYSVTITEVDADGEYVNSCWGTIVVEDKIAPTINPYVGPNGETIADDPATPEDESLCPCAVGNTNDWCDLSAICTDLDDVLSGAITAPQPNVEDNCDSDLTVSWTDQVIKTDDCAPIYIRRTWLYTDASGNTTSSCVNEYRINSLELPEDVVAPIPSIYLPCGSEYTADAIYDYYVEQLYAAAIDENSSTAEKEIARAQAEKDAYRYAYPTLDVNGHPIENTVCNLAVVKSDLEVYPCDEACTNMVKIIREWKVYNWCNGDEETYTQIIVTQDNDGPSVTVTDVTISVDPWGCFGAYDFPDPEHLFDECSSKVSYYVTGPDGVEIKYSVDRGYYVDDAPKGDHVFYYHGVDCCENITTVPVNVYIKDYTPPVAVAKQDIVISLTTNTNGEGIAKLFTFNVDNGSYDGCSPVHLEVRRQSDACGIDNNLTYNDDFHTFDNKYDTDEGQFVKFCCADLQGEDAVDADGDGEFDYALIKVWLRVWDDGDGDGHYGSAGDNFNETWAVVRLEDKLTPSIQCPSDIVIGCEEDYNDLNLVGSATAVASCNSLNVEYKDIKKVIDGCGAGYIKRKWYVVSNPAVSCVQEITITGSDTDDIVVTFPEDITTDCTYDFDDDKPTWLAGACDQMAWSVDIDTFYLEEGACYKILKHWKVINWCNYEPLNPNSLGIWEDVQVIKILDDNAPTLLTCDETVMLEANDYDDLDNDGNICESKNVMLTQVATDEGQCPSNWLKWNIQVDLNNDWNYEYVFSSFISTQDPFYVGPTQPGEQVKITLPDDIAGSMANHRVLWKVTDGCGNTTSCTTYFMVVDKKAPTPYCTNISTAFMVNGSVSIWACDFNLGSYDNCTEKENLRYTFTETHPDLDPDYIPSLKCSSMTFTCEDIPNGINSGAPVEVNMYVWDEKDNYAYCTVYLTIVDNNGGCDDDTSTNDGSGSPRQIGGNIHNEAGDMVSGVEVTVSSNQPEFPLNQMTDDNGHYAFTDVATGNAYQITSRKNTNFKAGVSTLDILLIQRHIMDLEVFQSPYTMIAADVNADDRISGADIVDLRRLILDITDSFPSNESWLFVNDDQELDLENPWVADKSLEINNLQSDMMQQNFMAVKVGDVNNSLELRSAELLDITFDNAAAIAGEQITVDFKATAAELYGLQLAIVHENLNVVNVTSTAFDVNQSNFVTADEMTTFSITSVDGVNLDREAVFTVTFEATADVTLSQSLQVATEVINSESYIGTDLNVGDVTLSSNVSGYTLYQNRPNPFSNATNIAFTLPEAGDATVTIFDIAGKIVYTSTNRYGKGLQSIQITKDMLTGSGVWFYRLDSGDFTDTKKLTLVK